MFFMALFLTFLISFSSFGKEVYLGKFGRVYEIKEKDLIKEMYERAKKVDYKKERKKIKNEILHFKPKDLEKLEKADKSQVYYVDYVTELQQDIVLPVNGEWKTIYKKGYKYRPLKYLKVKPIDLLVFNGKDKGELEFVKKNFVDKKIRVKLVLCDGEYRDVAKKLKAPVYYLFGNVQPLNLKKSISRVSVDTEKGKFKVTVYAVDEKGRLIDRDKYTLDSNSELVRKNEKVKN